MISQKLRHKSHIFLFCFILFLQNNLLFAQPKLDWVAKTGAKTFPSSQKIFSVNEYGAVSDATTVNSSFVQKAIDDCAKKGGGIAKKARRELESRTGKSVITGQNFLPPK